MSTTGWKLTNHHKTYLSVQYNNLRNCCSSVPITYQSLTTLIVWYLSLCWSGFGMLLLGKTQKTHPGDLPPTVPARPAPSTSSHHKSCGLHNTLHNPRWLLVTYSNHSKCQKHSQMDTDSMREHLPVAAQSYCKYKQHLLRTATVSNDILT